MQFIKLNDGTEFSLLN